MSRKHDQDGPIIIKKYANRRLYDTQTSSYVTLEDLCQMVKEDMEFVVRDAKSGEDLTRQILTQIILEQELKGVNSMPADFLRGVIKAHDEQMSAIMQSYLGTAMKAFEANQDSIMQYWEKGVQNFGHLSPLAQMEELGKRNMEFFQKSMEMFSPAGFFADDKTKKK